MAARYDAKMLPNPVLLFDRCHSTHRSTVVITLRRVAAQLQLHARQLADVAWVFVSRTSPLNGFPLLHRTVTLANRVPRSELSGILTSGGVIVTSNFGAAFVARTGFTDQARRIVMLF